MLSEERVIGSEKEFMNRAEETGAALRLKTGTYRFQRGEAIESILTKLELGLQAPEGALTVPEGYSISDIADLLKSKTGISPAAYIRAAQSGGRPLPLTGSQSVATLEGFLFPSTYNLEPGIDAGTIVERQLERFESETASAGWEKAARMGLSQYQALIVASMVEREAMVAEERPLVAAVIYNRMAAGMKLEVDATVQYALGYWKRDLTQEDLDIDSPYNTRRYAGLPPAPICNPGLDSIIAALNPAAVDFLFYVAISDGEGRHFFTSSYDEFLEAKNNKP